MNRSKHFKPNRLDDEDRQRIEEECRLISERFGASMTALTEGEDGLLFHQEFHDPKEFEKFAEYLKARGLLGVEQGPIQSDKVH